MEDLEKFIDSYCVCDSNMKRAVNSSGAPTKGTARKRKDPIPNKRQKRHSSSSSSGEEIMEIEISMIRSINERLGKLDILVELQDDIRELRKSLEFSQAQITDLRKENDTLKGTVLSLQNGLLAVQKETRLHKETLLDIQCRAMRENIIFSGLNEEENDKPELVLREFMCQKLKLPVETVQNIAFVRVHRLGGKGPNRPRPIIARFEHFKQKEMVKSQGKFLKGTNLWMNDQFPSEINERRKTLTPILKEHRLKENRVAMAVDRLYINGQLFKDASITPWLF